MFGITSVPSINRRRGLLDELSGQLKETRVDFEPQMSPKFSMFWIYHQESDDIKNPREE